MLVLITDRTHRDYNALIARWRLAGAKHIEYRDGGVWSRLHVSQYRMVQE
jgi:hypothetical protein